jgi:hypothetical protein
MNACGGSPTERFAGSQSLYTFVKETYCKLLEVTIGKDGLTTGLPILCRMDVSYMTTAGRAPHYFVNEVERGWATDIFVAVDQVWPDSLTVVDTLGDVLLVWAEKSTANILDEFFSTVLAENLK